MDTLPRELIVELLQQCIAYGPKNSVLRLRLVCRLFDRILKPYALRTLGLDFSRLSKITSFEQPQIDALQTIGYHCKSLYIDVMVLRDDCTFPSLIADDCWLIFDSGGRVSQHNVPARALDEGILSVALSKVLHE